MKEPMWQHKVRLKTNAFQDSIAAEELVKTAVKQTLSAELMPVKMTERHFFDWSFDASKYGPFCQFLELFFDIRSIIINTYKHL